MPEPDNPYSKHAVAVIHEGHHLGYIPDRHDWIASALREGHRLSCYVRKIEIAGWFFRRASFVGLEVNVEDEPEPELLDGRSYFAAASAAAEQKRRQKAAREACWDGLRLLAFLAMADNDVTAQELDIEHSYIKARLAMVGMECDDALVDAMLALSQGLSVTKWSLTRAVNRIAIDRKHYGLVLNAALKLADLGADPRGARIEALQRLQKAGKAKGWI